PHLLAAIDIVSGHMATDAEFSAGDADNNLVLDDHRSLGARLALLRVAIDDLPKFLARLRVEGDERRISLVQEDLAFGISETTVDRVAAHHRNNRWVLLRFILPDDLLLVCEVQGEHDVRERRVEPHRIADNERPAFV